MIFLDIILTTAIVISIANVNDKLTTYLKNKKQEEPQWTLQNLIEKDFKL